MLCLYHRYVHGPSLLQAFLRSVGWGCAAVVSTAMLCSLTLTPSLLLALDCLSVFEPYPVRLVQRCCCCQRRAAADTNDVDGRSGDGDEAPLLPGDERDDSGGAPASKSDAAVGGGRSCWLRVAWAVTGARAKWAVLAATVAIVGPFLGALSRLRPTSDDNLAFLLGSPSMDALARLRAHFAVGAIDPYAVLLTAADAPGGGGGVVMTSGYFEYERALIFNLLATQGPAGFLDAASVTALSFYGGRNVSFDDAARWLFDPSAPDFNASLPRSYRAEMLGDGHINAAGSAATVSLRTLVQPDTQAVVPFIVSVRGLLGSLPPAPPPLDAVRLHLFGGYTDSLDVQDALYALVPAEVSVACVYGRGTTALA